MVLGTCEHFWKLITDYMFAYQNIAFNGGTQIRNVHEDLQH